MSDVAPAVVKERLDAFAAAFLADPRPGLILEYGRLVFANDAARGLLGTAATDEFLKRLKASLNRGCLEADLRLQALGGVYTPVLQPARIREGQQTVICLLFKQRGTGLEFGCLSERELAVLMLLVRGLTNAKIAGELGISIETVRKHVARALEKTASKTRAGLVGRALGR